jgi:site-specific recombinase XerD
MDKLNPVAVIKNSECPIYEGHSQIIKSGLSFVDLIQRWLDSTRSIETKRSYKISIEDFFKSSVFDISYEIVKEVTVIDVEDYLDELCERKLKSNTIKARLSACSSFYDYLLSFKSNVQEIKLLNFNPFKNGIIKQDKAKKIIKNDASITEILTDEELKKLYGAIDMSDVKGLRDYAIIKLMVNGALRRSELVNLRIKDIYERDFEYWIHIEQGKGNKNRDNFINTDAVKAVEKYLTSVGRSIKEQSDDFIFKGLSTNGLNRNKLTTDAIKQLIEKYCKKAGIQKRISPHSFRHKTVTTLLENNVKPELVMEYCGHASINTTMRYWHNLNKVKNNAGRNISL